MFLSPWTVYFAAFTISLLGMLLGFAFATVCKLSWPKCRTVAFETGTQNVPLCLTIIMLSFPRSFANEALLFPCLYAMASVIYPFTCIFAWNWYKTCNSNQLEKIPMNVAEIEQRQQDDKLIPDAANLPPHVPMTSAWPSMWHSSNELIAYDPELRKSKYFGFISSDATWTDSHCSQHHQATQTLRFLKGIIVDSYIYIKLLEKIPYLYTVILNESFFLRRRN